MKKSMKNKLSYKSILNLLFIVVSLLYSNADAFITLRRKSTVNDDVQKSMNNDEMNIVLRKNRIATVKNKVAFKKPQKQIIAESPQEIEEKELSQSYYYKATKEALSEFQEQSFSATTNDLDVIFYSIEKRVVYQSILSSEIQYFEFSKLTNSFVRFVQVLKNSDDLTKDFKNRRLLQMNFYGLSQAIKKANEVNLMIQRDQFDKLHDMLLSHATSLFYASYEQVKYSDFFWTSYFLHELNYPMDLTAKHLNSLSEKIKNFKYPAKYREYGEKLSRLSLGFAQKISKPSSADLETLYSWAIGQNEEVSVKQTVQKNYLKQLMLIGDNEKIKQIKKEIASSVLFEEAKNFIRHPLQLFKFIQVIIGYIFVAWPLEMILFVVSIMIFAFQSSSVLTSAETIQAKNFPRRMWMMFTKAYLGSNVPFFSKLAASLILFGVGLYFNSAKNYVEAIISSL